MNKIKYFFIALVLAVATTQAYRANHDGVMVSFEPTDFDSAEKPHILWAYHLESDGVKQLELNLENKSEKTVTVSVTPHFTPLSCDEFKQLTRWTWKKYAISWIPFYGTAYTYAQNGVLKDILRDVAKVSSLAVGLYITYYLGKRIDAMYCNYDDEISSQAAAATIFSILASLASTTTIGHYLTKYFDNNTFAQLAPQIMDDTFLVELAPGQTARKLVFVDTDTYQDLKLHQKPVDVTVSELN